MTLFFFFFFRVNSSQDAIKKKLQSETNIFLKFSFAERNYLVSILTDNTQPVPKAQSVERRLRWYEVKGK